MSIHLRQQRADIVRKMGEVLQSNHADKMATWRALNVKQEALRAQIDSIEARSRFDLPGVGDLAETESLSAHEQRYGTSEYRKAFVEMLKRGDVSELRALGEDVSTGGQTLVPIGFQKEIAVYSKAWGNWTDRCRTLTTATGGELQYPVEIDTSDGTATGTYASGTYYAENAGPVTEVEPTLKNVLIYSDLMDAGISLVPVSLFQDSAFSIEALLAQTFGRRIGRGEDSWFMLGNSGSSGRITGLLPSLTAGGSGAASVLALGANANSGNAGDTDLNSIGSQDFSNLIAAVDVSYRNSPSAGFVGNQKTWDKLRSILDKYGRPIWSVSLAAEVPDQILGYPYRFSQSLATIGAGDISVVFGDFSQCVIRRALGMTMVRYNEKYMDHHQLGYQMFERVFQSTLIPSAFSYLTHPLS